MTATRLPDAYFAKLYETTSDPWGFETRAYERRKYDITLDTLPRDSYEHAFEPGCSIGVLSERLAERCHRLTSMELVPRIAQVARERLRRFERARVVEGALPEAWPEGRFDLVVFSEVLYYLTGAGLTAVLSHLDRSLVPSGHLLAVHYRGATDYPLTGDEVHARLGDHLFGRYVRLVIHAETEFVAELYERRGA